ncbi:MAG: hypothetical protein JSS24_03095 [Proteobacteria bacterium]|nr:hypothetical protein [Pseudomonadota bacterium]
MPTQTPGIHAIRAPFGADVACIAEFDRKWLSELRRGCEPGQSVNWRKNALTMVENAYSRRRFVQGLAVGVAMGPWFGGRGQAARGEVEEKGAAPGHARTASPSYSD